MKGFSAKLIPLISVLVFPVIASLAPPAVKAQTERSRPNASGPVGGTNTSPAREPSIRERQLMMDDIAREAGRPRLTEEKRIAIVQIAEDFQQIQILNNKMMGATMKAATPDYGNIASSTAEIKKRASRIRSNLELPKADSDAAKTKQEYKPIVDEAAMKAALLALDKSIMSFVENQLFQNPNLIDLKQATKASSDLETIIESSRLISKDAERLGSSSRKRP
jgi:hypothetical protein